MNILHKSINKTTILTTFIVYLVVMLLVSSLQITSTDDIPFQFKRIDEITTRETTINVENEHWPGAIYYFFSMYSLSQGNYMQFFYFYNIFNFFILYSIGLIYFYYKGKQSLFIYLLILIFSGFLPFHRFEPIVILTVLLSLISFSKKKQKLSFILLGIATTIKIYPIIIVPYYLLISYKRAGIRKVLENVFIYFISVFIIMLSFIFLFNSSFNDIYNANRFHKDKPVSTESTWSTFIFTLNDRAEAEAKNNIMGFNENSIIMPKYFYNYIWIVPLAILYIIISRNNKTNYKLKPEIIILIISLFLLFSKILTPQYIYWFSFLTPLLIQNNQDIKRNSTLLITLLAFILLYTVIFPFNYYKWVSSLSSENPDKPLEFINNLKNLLFIAVNVILVKKVIKNKVNNS